MSRPKRLIRPVLTEETMDALQVFAVLALLSVAAAGIVRRIWDSRGPP